MCAMKCLYFVVTHEIPHMTNYVDLLRFVEHLGCDQLQMLSVGKNATYTSMQTIVDYLISDCIEEVILSKLKGLSHFRSWQTNQPALPSLKS